MLVQYKVGIISSNETCSRHDKAEKYFHLILSNNTHQLTVRQINLNFTSFLLFALKNFSIKSNCERLSSSSGIKHGVFSISIPLFFLLVPVLLCKDIKTNIYICLVNHFEIIQKLIISDDKLSFTNFAPFCCL